MLIRISLIVALIAGLAVAALNFVKVRDKITTLISQRDTEHAGRMSAENERDATKRDLAKTQTKLKDTETELASTQKERDDAVATADAATKKASDLSDKLAKTTDDLNNSKARVAQYENTGFQPEQLLTIGKQIKGLQDELDATKGENKVLTRNVQTLKNQLAELTQPDFHVPLPPGLKGKILVADPKWDFVVLNVGEDEGAAQHGELLVCRDGRLVAKLRIETVEKGRCIANVLPGWKLGDVMEGDEVIPAYVPTS
jgi:uncharacterized membrane protein